LRIARSLPCGGWALLIMQEISFNRKPVEWKFDADLDSLEGKLKVNSLLSLLKPIPHFALSKSSVEKGNESCFSSSSFSSLLISEERSTFCSS
jgi:hypothetical protein